jgi:glutamate transport system substrate-binding protein
LITLLAAGAALVAVTVACQNDQETTADDTQRSAHGPLYDMNRALRIGVKTDLPGIGLADSTGGNNTGLDIDIGKEIAAALRDQPVFQAVVSRDREQLILSGAVDLVIASYSITESRLEKIAFAGPYLIAGQDILVRSADASAYTGVASLRDKKVCVAKGSSSYEHLEDRFSAAWAKKYIVTEVAGQPILGYRECVNLLLAGAVDAVSTDNVILAGFASEPQNRGRLQVVGERFSYEKYGIGLAKGNPADTALINATLRQMIKDGRWAAIVRKNLGAAAPMFLKPENVPTPPPGL